MNKLISAKMIYALIALVLIIVVFLVYKRHAGQAKVSEFGKYQGYSEKIYDGTKRISDYLTLSIGTKLAYDLILPTKKAAPADRPLPVLFLYTPYLRTFIIFDENGKDIISDLYRLKWYERAYLRVRYWFYDRGNLIDPLFRKKWLGNMVKHGYAVVVVERPGTGASFGKMNPSFEVVAKETDEILNWIAAQKWCDGNIGMYGESWQGAVQLAAASTANPHLKAIFPAASWIDNYSAMMYSGGIYNKAFGEFFTWSQKFLSSNVITPVDQDKDGAMLARARAERSSGIVTEKIAASSRKIPYRDSLSPDGNNVWIDMMALYPFFDRINRSGIPVYMTTGWYDLCTRDNFLLYANLTVPKRLVVRPLDHEQLDETQFDLDYAAEAHRWFDYWLKGIKNGIMDEPPIHYYLMGGDKKNAWKVTGGWPTGDQKNIRYYFGPGETGGTTSINNGTLDPSSPTAPEASDTYTIDYTTTSSNHSRWTAVNWTHDYPNMRSNDAKALTYTTRPLEKPVQATGHSVIHVWLKSDAPDLDMFAYLEEVDGSGNSTYITEGNLRASHRTLGQAPYDNLGLPYHRHYKSDLAPIPASEPVELVFDLLPTSYIFGAGNRIRITIACADADNFETPILDPAPKLHLLRDSNHPSFFQLPVVPSR
jgi:putative CocE/NonD family hydrolase